MQKASHMASMSGPPGGPRAASQACATGCQAASGSEGASPFIGKASGRRGRSARRAKAWSDRRTETGLWVGSPVSSRTATVWHAPSITVFARR